MKESELISAIMAIKLSNEQKTRLLHACEQKASRASACLLIMRIAACAAALFIAMLGYQMLIQSPPPEKEHDESPMYSSFANHSLTNASVCCRLHTWGEFMDGLHLQEGIYGNKTNIGIALTRAMERDGDENKIYPVIIGSERFVREFLDTHRIENRTYSCFGQGEFESREEWEAHVKAFTQALEDYLPGVWEGIRRETWVRREDEHAIKAPEYAASLKPGRIRELAEKGFTVRLVGDGSIGSWGSQEFLEWVVRHMQPEEKIQVNFWYGLPEGELPGKEKIEQLVDKIFYNAGMSNKEYINEFYIFEQELCINFTMNKTEIERLRAAYPDYMNLSIHDNHDSPTVVLAYDTMYGDNTHGILYK